MSAFVTSDTHFGHSKSITFLKPDGNLLRPFSSVEEMDEIMVENWNKKVGIKDTIYHLGDVAIPRRGLKILERCNGRKILIKGNHDIYKLPDYLPYFADIRGCHVKDSLVFTHIPIHSESFEGRYKGNVHGHLHCHLVMDGDEPDKRYFNSCVEQHDFAPVAFEDVKKYFRLP